MIDLTRVGSELPATEGRSQNSYQARSIQELIYMKIKEVHVFINSLLRLSIDVQ